MKPLGRALGRLSEVLGPAERRELQMAMLEDVLRAAVGTPGLSRVLVVTLDPEAADLAVALGCATMSDHRPPQGMNAAIARGLASLAEAGSAALVLMSDIPLAAPEALAAIVRQVTDEGLCLAVPSRDGKGTNALALSPAHGFVPGFGPDSLRRHREEARRTGRRWEVVVDGRIGLDVDTPEDLAALAAAGMRCLAGDALARMRALQDVPAGA